MQVDSFGITDTSFDYFSKLFWTVTGPQDYMANSQVLGNAWDLGKIELVYLCAFLLSVSKWIEEKYEIRKWKKYWLLLFWFLLYSFSYLIGST